MRVSQVVAGVFLFLSVLVISAFAYVLWSKEITLIEGNEGIVVK